MKKVLFTFLAAMASTIATAQAPAFPGAEGVARYTTTGGRGGKIIHVTNLNDDGTGSLRAAIKASGARIVVFDVSGTIALKSALKINNDNITILGQTAPGDGICLKGYTLNINCNNAIVRFIRCRLGDETLTNDDAMNGYHKTGQEKSNVIVDHCTMSWSTDECGSFYGIKNFTMQWCMLSESLANSIHEKGAHGYGGIWGGQNAAYHHNLLASHTSRNPRFDHDYVNTLKGPVDYINNVIYNWGGNSAYGGESANDNNEFKMYNIINNYYKAGSTSSHKNRIVNPTTKCSNCTKAMGTSTIVPGHFYITGNYVQGYANVTADNWLGVEPDDASKKSSIKSTARFVADNSDQLLTTHKAETAYEKVLAYVGASYKRDAVDQRIVKETRSGSYTYQGSNGSTGGFIDTQNDVGGWPTLAQYGKLADSDNDGMPDVWETANGLDPHNAADASAKTLDAKGYYTNIEVYANALVEDLVKAQNADADFAVEEYYPAVQKAEGVAYYDGKGAKGDDPGEDDPDVEDQAEGNITWGLSEGTENPAAAVDASLSKYIDATGITIGSHLKVYGTKKTDFVMTTYTITDETSDAGATADNAVTFYVKPKDGYFFAPKSIAFDATRFGTDHGKFAAYWQYADGSQTEVAEEQLANRDNATPKYTSISKTLENAKVSTDKSGLAIHLFDIPFNTNTKSMGLANVVILGTISKAVADGIQSTTAQPAVTEYYNLQGMRTTSPTTGIYIRVDRNVSGQSTTQKVYVK